MLTTTRYNREMAVAYAKEWALRRNPKYLDFHDIGGDCTNFISQCLYAANPVMNFTPTYGWYYITASNRAPSWTSVLYLHRFLTNNQSAGPFAAEVPIDTILPGDIIQLKNANDLYYHTLLVTKTADTPAPENILVAAHTDDSLDRPLDTYFYAGLRCLHIEGVRTQ